MDVKHNTFVKDENGKRVIDTKGHLSLMDIDEEPILGGQSKYKVGYGYADGDDFNYVGLHDFTHDRRNIYVSRQKLPEALDIGDSMVLPQYKCDDDFIHTNMYRLVVYKGDMNNKAVRRFSGCRFII